MTRKQFLRLLIAFKFCVTGNAALFMWLLSKRSKLPIDPMYWTMKTIVDYPGFLPDDLFYTANRMPLRFLLESNPPMSGGTYISKVFDYGERESVK